MGSHSLQLEDGPPGCSYDLLDIRLGHDKGTFQFRPNGFRTRQRAPIDLAIGCERQRIQSHENRRDHVFRQSLLQKPRQTAGCGRLLLMGNEVGHQAPVARPILLEHDHGLSHIRVPNQGRFDFFDFDPETANLDLIVEPAQVFDIAIGEESRQITGSVKTFAGGFVPPGISPLPNGSGMNFSAVNSGRLRYPLASPAPPMWSSPGDTDRAGPKMTIKNIDLRIGDRAVRSGRPRQAVWLAAPDK